MDEIKAALQCNIVAVR